MDQFQHQQWKLDQLNYAFVDHHLLTRWNGANADRQTDTDKRESKLSWKAAESDFVFSGPTMRASNKTHILSFINASQGCRHSETRRAGGFRQYEYKAVHTS
jgi:hypothetical protein